MLKAEGEAKAIDTVFTAIHKGNPTRELLSYEYIQMLPALAEGDSNKVFVVPSEFAEAFGGIGETLRAGSGRKGGRARQGRAWRARRRRRHLGAAALRTRCSKLLGASGRRGPALPRGG